jgi:hypothetical protein
MSKKNLTDEQVEKEIERLIDSPLVKLARKEMRIKYKRRQFLYSLRNLEKRGRELQKSGITMDILNGIELETPNTEEENINAVHR